MNENSNGNGNPSNTEIEEVQALDANATEEQRAEYITKLESNNKQLYARTKKAEGFVQDKDGKWVKPQAPKTEKKPDETIVKPSELSQADLIFIAKSDIHVDDIEELTQYAKFKGISLSQAHNDGIMKGILAGKAEARRVAEGTNTGGGKRGNAKLSDEALIENASKGKLPDNDADLTRLTQLNLKRLK